MSLVGFKAQNHPQQKTKDSVDDRRTPRGLFNKLFATYHFTLDAAASKENALCPWVCTKEQNGLVVRWVNDSVWCTPPYSDIEPWLVKAWQEMGAGCHSVVMLLPANRCEQGWWQRHVEPYRDGGPRDGVWLRTRFLAGRLRMPAPGIPIPKKRDRPPFGCVLLTWTKTEPTRNAQ